MPDEVHKTFVRSFINYLKKQTEPQTMAPDTQESVEVAIQCLQAAYDIFDDEENGPSPDTEETPAGSNPPVPEIDLFELFQSFYVEKNPKSLEMAESIKNEGNRLMKDGKYNEALLQYNRAITFDPRNPIFYCNRAAAYIRLGDHERAISDCKSALLYNPKYGKAYGRLGIAYSNLGRYDEAQQAYTKAIELEPDNQDYRNNLEVARNAPPVTPLNTVHNLHESLNAMLSHPTFRNLFSDAEIDIGQLSNMSQNPTFINALEQMLSGIQGGGAGNPLFGGGNNPNTGNSGGAGHPQLPTDMLQLFQNFITQLSSYPGAGNQTSGGTPAAGNNPSQPDPPPPSSS